LIGGLKSKLRCQIPKIRRLASRARKIYKNTAKFNRKTAQTRRRLQNQQESKLRKFNPSGAKIAPND